MTPHPEVPRRGDVSLLALVPFILITFGLAWGILALYVFLPDQATTLFGELTGLHPLFFLATWSPAVAAIAIILFRGGPAAIGRYLRRLGLWRCSPAWYAFILVGIPFLFMAGSLVKGNLFTDGFPAAPLQTLLFALALAAIKGPVEELGWRGLALPLLQRKMAPLWAGLLVGIIWGIWHLPAFLISSTQQGSWSFMPFFLGSVAISVMMVPLFNAARGSILLPALFHWQLINPFWPDAQPYDTVFFVAAAFVIVVLNRRSMFRKEESVTHVIPQAERDALSAVVG